MDCKRFAARRGCARSDDRQYPGDQHCRRRDRAYHERFFGLAGVLPSADRLPVMRRARAEVALENAVRVLRLRFFFHLDLEKSRGLLVPGSSAAVRRSLEEAFETPADSAEEWRRWRYASLLDDQLGESFRAPDPLRAEQAAARLLYRRAHQAFHQHPFTLGPLVAYFRLKDYEASMLSVAAEALHLGVPEADVLGIVSAPGGGPSASGGTQSASGGAGER